MTSCCRLNIESAAVYEPCVWHVKNTRPLTQGLFKVVEINHPLVLSLSKDGRRWFDKLTMSGGWRPLKRPWPLTRTRFNLPMRWCLRTLSAADEPSDRILTAALETADLFVDPSGLLGVSRGKAVTALQV